MANNNAPVARNRKNYVGIFIPIFIAAGFYTIFTIIFSRVNSFVLSTSPVLWGLWLLLWIGIGIAWRWHLTGGLVLVLLNVLPYIGLFQWVEIYDPMGMPSVVLIFALFFLYNGPLMTSAIILVVKGWKEF